MLCFAELLFFFRVPADGCRIKQDLRNAEGGAAGGFRIPLIPTDADADFPARRVPAFEAEVAGSEIEFLVVQRVVGNVHLAVFPEQFAVAIDDDGGVVVETSAALLEK